MIFVKVLQNLNYDTLHSTLSRLKVSSKHTGLMHQPVFRVREQFTTPFIDSGQEQKEVLGYHFKSVQCKPHQFNARCSGQFVRTRIVMEKKVLRS